MKNLKNFVSIFLIISILSMNAGVFVSPVFAFEKEDFYFKRIEDNLLPKISKESSCITKEFREKAIADRQTKTKLNKNEITSLKSSKNAERINQEGKNYVEGEILIKYKDTKIDLNTSSGRAIALNFNNSKSLEKKEELKNNNISVLRIKDTKTVEQKISELKNNPNIDSVQPNFQYYPTEITTNDANKDLLWGLDNTGQSVNGVSGTNNADIDAPEAWAISEGSSDVIVAVIDTGVAYNHPDLVANMWDGSNCLNEDGVTLGGCNHGYDYEDSDNNPLPTTSSHGTHIAGTIAAAKDNNKGIIGVAPQAKIMAIKSSLTTSNIVEGINFAQQNGAKIINASWGSYSTSGGFYDVALYNAIDEFSGLFVVAAGNKGYDHDDGVDAHKSYPDGFKITTSIGPGLDNIIVVAAIDQNDALATFSDYGIASVDVGAPGTNIYSTISDNIIFSEDFNDISVGYYEPGQFVYGGETDNWWGIGNNGSSNAIYSDYFVKKYAPSYSYEIDADTFIMSKDATNLSNSNIKGATLNFMIWCDTPNSSTYDDYISTFHYSNGIWSISDKYDEDKIRSDGGSSWVDSGYSGYYKSYSEDISDHLSSDFKYVFNWKTDHYTDYNLGCWIDNIKVVKYSDGTDEQYGYGDGTSMAAPHVAGLAGLIWGYKPELTYSQIKDIILTTGDRLPDLFGKTVTGKRINAYNALESLADTTNPVITLLGTDPVNLYLNDSYTDAGATALDDVDGDITENIVTINPVDTSTVGTYIIIYNVSDTAANAADQVTRTVNVSARPSGGGGVVAGGSYNPTPTIPVISTTTTQGDMNKDNKVNKYDFSLLMSNWGKTGSNVSDLNGDSKVDKYDFSLLMSNWSI